MELSVIEVAERGAFNQMVRFGIPEGEFSITSNFEGKIKKSFESGVMPTPAQWKKALKIFFAIQAVPLQSPQLSFSF